MHSEDEIDDFHYGVAPQALINLRLIAGRRAALELTAWSITSARPAVSGPANEISSSSEIHGSPSVSFDGTVSRSPINLLAAVPTI